MKVFPRDLHAKYDVSELPGQFILSKDPKLVPQGWDIRSLGQWILGTHSALPFVEIHSGVAPVGWLLGYAVDVNGELMTSKVVLDECTRNSTIPESFERTIYRFGGRYAAVLIHDGMARVYLDCCGSLTVVYCPSQKLVASTPSLIPYSADVRDDDELITGLGFPDSVEMFPIGLTAKIGVERLLPNHYLDLNIWCAVRHWPSGFIPRVRDVQHAIDRIATLVKRSIGALVGHNPHLALTAGQDSRMLLACSRQFTEVLTCFTVWTGNVASKIDYDLASRMCRGLGVRHIPLRFEDPRRLEVGKWLFRTGFGLGGIQGSWRGATAVRQLSPYRVDLSGHIGELGRANYWPTENPSRDDIIPAKLAVMCGFPWDSTTQLRFQRWLTGLPALEPDHVLDFFYLEQRLGCWAGIMPFGAAEEGQFHVFPLCHREIIEVMLGLPRSYRWQGSLLLDIIQREWPELLRYPINTPIGIQRAWVAVERMRDTATTNVGRLIKAARNPTWAGRKIIERITTKAGSR